MGAKAITKQNAVTKGSSTNNGGVPESVTDEMQCFNVNTTTLFNLTLEDLLEKQELPKFPQEKALQDALGQFWTFKAVRKGTLNAGIGRLESLPTRIRSYIS